ncbi:MAG: component of SufBCD complex [Pararhodobacter sp.]|nr:component of SufBCD complex [Pararhodobacter sp.]
MDWYQSVLSLIDLRSFSNLWYWIALAVMWSSLSHYVLGVPFDMVQRARRQKGDAMADLERLVDIQVRRQLYILQTGGMWVVGFWAATLTMLLVLGFAYRIEVAQALTLMLVPMSLVFLLGFRLAFRLDVMALKGEALTRRLVWHRLTIQMIGLVSILITAIWGMWYNLSLNVLGR